MGLLQADGDLANQLAGLRGREALPLLKQLLEGAAVDKLRGSSRRAEQLL